MNRGERSVFGGCGLVLGARRGEGVVRGMSNLGTYPGQSWLAAGQYKGREPLTKSDCICDTFFERFSSSS